MFLIHRYTDATGQFVPCNPGLAFLFFSSAGTAVFPSSSSSSSSSSLTRLWSPWEHNRVQTSTRTKVQTSPGAGLNSVVSAVERQPGPSPHHVGAGLVLVQPAGLVLDQLLAAVAHRGPAAARLLGRVDQTLAVRGPGAGRVEDLPRLHPADLTVRQKVAHKLLPLERWRRSMR